MSTLHNIKGKHRPKTKNKTKVYYINENNIYNRQGIDRFCFILFTYYCICEEVSVLEVKVVFSEQTGL